MDTMTGVKNLFERALQLHQAGQLNFAEQLYNDILRKQPNHEETIHLLGLIRFQESDYLKAIVLIERALEIDPYFAVAHYNLGRCYEQIAESEKAIQSYSKSLSLNSDDADCYLGLGNVQFELMRLESALGNFEKAIELNAKLAEAHSNRGNVLKELKRLDEALASYDRAIALKPGFAEAHSNRGNVLKELKRFEEALASHDKAISLKPDYAEAHSNRSNVLKELMRLDEALVSNDRAISLKPDHAEAHYNRGNVLKHLKRLDEALVSYDRAISLMPGYAEAHLNRGILFLLVGNFEKGFADYEYRKLKPKPVGARKFAQPLWLGGEALEGKTILIHHEQGLGDSIQFVRYIHLVSRLATRVLFEPPNQLMTLFKDAFQCDFIASNADNLPDFDFHCPLLSLPLALKTSQASIPAIVPYISPDANRVKKWQNKIGIEGFKIGICWQGSKAKIDAGRSFPLAHFESISKLAGIRLISIHKGEGEDQLKSLPDCMRVETLGDEFDSGDQAFLDTAAVMKICDLVITSDTAIAHLAGALALPTWVALKYVPDWRWLLDRHDSIWYPTMKLFRQKALNDWNGVFVEMESALKRHLSKECLENENVDRSGLLE